LFTCYRAAAQIGLVSVIILRPIIGLLFVVFVFICLLRLLLLSYFRTVVSAKNNPYCSQSAFLDCIALLILSFLNVGYNSECLKLNEDDKL